MFSSKDGKMIILSSPSGAGKTTLAKFHEKHFKISISHTTRSQDQTKKWVDYFFFSKTIWKTYRRKSILEYANVFKNLYGSTKEQVIKNLENGDNVLFDIDWQGAQQIKNQVLNLNLYLFYCHLQKNITSKINNKRWK